MTHFHFYYLACLLWLALPIFKAWPVVLLNKDRAVNTMLLIKMKPEAFYVQRDLNFMGTLAQERVEWWLKWFVALLIASPTPFFVTNPVLMIFFPVLAYLWSLPGFKFVEYVGHAAEVIYDGRPGYLEREALSMRMGYDGKFRADDTETGLKRAMPIARVLLFLVARK